MKAILASSGVERGLQRTEPLAERHLLLVGESLTMEDEDRMLLERGNDHSERPVVDRAGEIGPLDARADVWQQGRDGQAHESSLGWRIYHEGRPRNRATQLRFPKPALSYHRGAMNTLTV